MFSLCNHQLWLLSSHGCRYTRSHLTLFSQPVPTRRLRSRRPLFPTLAASFLSFPRQSTGIVRYKTMKKKRIKNEMRIFCSAEGQHRSAVNWVLRFLFDFHVLPQDTITACRHPHTTLVTRVRGCLHVGHCRQSSSTKASLPRSFCWCAMQPEPANRLLGNNDLNIYIFSFLLTITIKICSE